MVRKRQVGIQTTIEEYLKRKSDNSSEPATPNDGDHSLGSWYDEIQQLKQELTKDGGRLHKKLKEHEKERIEGREELDDKAKNLQVGNLLTDINNKLLDGEGVIENKFRWYIAEDFGFDEPEIAFPVLSMVLYWRQGRRLEFDVELVGVGDEIQLYINREEFKPTEAEVLQYGLLKSFREQMNDE